MNAIRATWSNGQIVPVESVDWPEGSALIVEPLGIRGEKVGLSEAEWRNDPDAIAEWEAWLTTLQPMELTAVERAARERYDAELRQFNLDAMRRQMEAEGGQ